MKVPGYIKNNLKRQSELSEKIRILSRDFANWCDENNIDEDTSGFYDAHGMIGGDCSEIYMIEYLEKLGG